MSTNMTVSQNKTRRAWPVLLLALPAFVAIWSGWVELGRLTGFGEVKPLPGIWNAAKLDTAITLPIGVETYAAYALNVWLAGGTSARATRFARVSALGSLALGAAGQVAYHLMSAAGMTAAPWPITAVVACLPVAVLGMGAALHHLVTEHPAFTATEAPDTDQAGAPAGTDDAEVRTERAVIENAMRERHPDWPVGTVAEMAEALATVGHLPTPAPRAIPAESGAPAPAPTGPKAIPTRVTRTSARTASTRKAPAGGTAVKVRALREKHPDWTAEQIAAKAGVTDRTVRRHLKPSISAAPAPSAEAGEAPAAPDLAA